MNTIAIESMSDLVAKLTSFGSGWMFRGQSDSRWELTSSLERITVNTPDPGLVSVRIQEATSYEFESKAHLYCDPVDLPRTPLGLLAMMQHHGAPTRLLDFTLAPFVALYFSFYKKEIEDNLPCSVFAVNYRQINKRSLLELSKRSGAEPIEYNDPLFKDTDSFFSRLLENEPVPALWALEPSVLNARLNSQKGSFLYSSDPSKAICDYYNPDDFIHYQLEPAIHHEARNLLKAMGVDSCLLFGSLDALGEDLRWKIIDILSQTTPSL